MNILVMAQYYAPEEVAAAVWIPQLTTDLVKRGHSVTMATAFPNYPKRILFAGSRGRVFQREVIDGVKVVRTWIYTNPAESAFSRVLNWGSYCVTSFFGGLLAGGRPDVIYAIQPPLPLGMGAIVLGRLKRCAVVCNIQDIYPLIAVELGILRNRWLIRFFEWMERWIYRHATRLVAISSGFKHHFVSCGAPAQNVDVVPNWADPESIRPGPKHNEFRAELGIDKQFVVLYSGTLSHNSGLEPILEVAERLRGEAVRFVIVGDGVKKPWFEEQVQQRRLDNVLLRPFQALDRYGQVLAAADVTLVALSRPASLASVPSKIFKQMAAGRPILAITAPGTELDNLLNQHHCGLSVPPEDPDKLLAALGRMRADPQWCESMGGLARQALVEHYARDACVNAVENLLKTAIATSPRRRSQ